MLTSLCPTRAFWKRLGIVAALWLATPWVAWGQQDGNAPLPSGVTIESDTPSLVVEWIVVAALVGGVLFAICRSGRRN